MWIAQISDPHVRPAGVRYKDTMDTNAALAAAVRQINALEPLPDLVILSGDVVDEGDAAEYDNARAILGDLRAPLMLIPGNHDDRARFRSAFASNLADSDAVSPSGPLHQVHDTAGPVRIVALDVTVPGRHHGQMTDEAADWLERTLAAEPDRPTVLVMHQPPIDSGIPYLDKYKCRDGHLLEAVVARFQNVHRVLCGHVHRTITARFGGTILCIAPSTGTAIALRTLADAIPASALEPPGFLLHHWRDGAGMLTHLVPIGDFPGPFPFG
jgi:3',5'-cyclic-AMP phosphodiesterase